MREQATVPKRFSLLRGLSVFDPSQAFISEMRSLYWQHLESFEPGEKVLWIGAPDFRLFFISFGSSQIYPLILMGFFGIMMNFFDTDPVHASKKTFIFLIFLLGIFLLMLTTLYYATSFLCITYMVTSQKLYIFFPTRTPLLIKSKSIRKIVKKNKYIICYDIKSILSIEYFQLMNIKFGTILFDSSVDQLGSVINTSKIYINKTRIFKRIFLQQYRFGQSPLNRIVAIHDADRLLGLIDEYRELRINFTGASPDTKLIPH